MQKGASLCFLLKVVIICYTNITIVVHVGHKADITYTFRINNYAKTHPSVMNNHFI